MAVARRAVNRPGPHGVFATRSPRVVELLRLERALPYVRGTDMSRDRETV
jgi:tRNA (Thr-GGU) A37 N-methylase